MWKELAFGGGGERQGVCDVSGAWRGEVRIRGCGKAERGCGGVWTLREGFLCPCPHY